MEAGADVDGADVDTGKARGVGAAAGAAPGRLLPSPRLDTLPRGIVGAAAGGVPARLLPNLLSVGIVGGGHGDYEGGRSDLR
jgi:hypothetical protein